MTDSYQEFLEATDGLEPFTVEWFRILAEHSSRLIDYVDLTEDLQDLIDSGGGGGVSDTFDFGTFSSPADFTLDFGTY
jgi:hypothetical protein